MKKTIFLLGTVVAMISLVSCGSKYEKTKDGVLYKVTKGKHTDTTKVKATSFVKIKVKQYIGDSLLQEESAMAMYMPQTNLGEPFLGVQGGDMVELAMSVDSILAKNPMVPPFVQKYKGGMMKTQVKVLGVFDDLAKVDADRAIEMEPLKAKEDSQIVAYLKKNNINAEKHPNGVYIEKLAVVKGTPAGDVPKKVTVRYKGNVLGDTAIFDQNMNDPKKPGFEFQTKSHQTVEGFDYAVSTMAKGDHIRVYIPAMLAYGEKAAGEKIPAFSNLVFELILEDVKDIPAPTAPAAQMQPAK